MSGQPAHRLAILFGNGWTRSNPRFSAGLGPLCLSYLTYIYIYYIESSAAPHSATPAKKIVDLVGQGWAAYATPRKAKKKAPFLRLEGLGAAYPQGWAA